LASSTGRRLPVFVITGTSGAGKGTLVQALLERVPEVELAVSATTRERRPGEEEGVHYWYISDGEFDRIRERGKAPLLELEPNGARAVKERIPDAIVVFITAPSFDELERRLRERATESAGEIEERLELSRRQLEQADQSDFVVVNDDLERATDELVGIVRRALDCGAVAGPINTPPGR
jgi:guanylate kinase